MNDADFGRSIRMLASSEADEGPLPDAALIWTKATARRRLEESERGSLAIRRAEAIIAAAAVAGAVVFFPVGIFQTLSPIVLCFASAALVVSCGVSALLLRMLLADE